MDKTQLLKKYLEKHPNLPSLTLAKMFYNEYPESFKDVEAVRDSIRYYRGARGEKLKKHLTDRRFLREFGSYNPFEMPESDEREFEPFKIEGFKKILILGDVHVPYHSVEALNLMVEKVIKEGIDCILLNGDIVDFYHSSKFDKDPRNRNLSDELKLLREFIYSLFDIFHVPIFYKLGNHEERWYSFMRVKAPELLGIAEIEFENILNIPEVIVIKDKRTVNIGKLNVLHGHELKSGLIAPVNIARGVFLRTNAPTLVHHWHIKTSHGESTLNNKYIECWSVGCMCELHPHYMPNNRWIHGFAIVELDENGVNFNVNNYKIIKGVVYE